MKFKHLEELPGVSLSLPEHWSHSVDEGILTCFDEESGLGALHLSVFTRIERSNPTAEEAKSLAIEFALESGWQLAEESIALANRGEHVSAYFSSTTDEAKPIYWLVVHLLTSEAVILMTYNCEAGNASVESETVWRIIESLRAK